MGLQGANGNIPYAAFTSVLKADGPHSDPPRPPFPLLDLCDGSVLRGAGDTAARERRSENLSEPDMSSKIALDRARHCGERGIVLDREETRCTRSRAQPAKIISHEVDDHDMLGAVLFVRQFSQRAGCARTLHRLRIDGRSTKLKKEFRTTRNDSVCTVANERCVRHVGMHDESREQC